MPLEIHVDARRGWDTEKEEFVTIEEQDLVLEHCLLAIARWEAKTCKKFFTESHTYREWLDYISCMNMTNSNTLFAYALSPAKVTEILDYIQKSQTATTFSEEKNTPNGERLTSELLYYYMAQVPLPFDICERWHFSRLISILKIASIKSQPDKKMSHSQIAAQNRALNAARKAKLKGMHK